MNNKKVQWVHSDKRGLVLYASMQALAQELGVTYETVRHYLRRGFSSDKDVRTSRYKRKKDFQPSSNKRAAMIEAFKRNGIKWGNNE